MKMNWDAVKKFWTNVQTGMESALDEKEVPHKPAPREEGRGKRFALNVLGGYVAAQVVMPVVGLLGVPLLPLALGYVAFRGGYKIAKTAQDIKAASDERADVQRFDTLASVGEAISDFKIGFGKAFSAMFNDASSGNNGPRQSGGQSARQRTSYRPGA